MPTDMLLFSGGLKSVGVPSEKKWDPALQVRHYADLDELLGRDWHFRGININGDYGYVVLQTVDYYFRKSQAFIEYIPSKQQRNVFDCIETATGYSLVFSFVCDFGTSDTFGTDKAIFT